MKKFFTMLIVAVFMLTSCGGGKPDDVSQEMYDYAVYAIKVTDLYLNGDCSIEETYKKLRDISLPEIEFDYGRENKKDSSVNISISSLRTTALLVKLGSNNLSDLKKDRDELAKKINYKK